MRLTSPPEGGFSICKTICMTAEGHDSWYYLEAFCVHAKLLQSCLTLGGPRDCSPPGSSVHGILQTRILEWIAFSFSHNRGYFPAYLTVSLEGIRLWICMSFCVVFQTPFTLSFWKSLGPWRSSLLDHLYPASRREYKMHNSITTTVVQKRCRLVNT